MFRFEHPEYLYLLVILPMIAGIFLYRFRQAVKQRRKLSTDPLFRRLIPDWNTGHQWVRFGLFPMVFFLLIIALANPQWATQRERVKAMSSDIIIALDISQSMMVQDIPPNRLERAKKVIEKLILELKGNRIGLIFFAGEAYIQMPLTSDYAAALMFLKSANTGQIATQGTAISEAIDLADKSFTNDRDHQRALVLFTDGEDHDGAAVERAGEVHSKGMYVFSFSVGTVEGDFIPYVNAMGVQSYKKDDGGNFIRSAVNVALLDDLAVAGGGKYYTILDGESAVDDLIAQLDQIEKREMEQRSFTSYDTYFQYFVGIAFILLLLEFIWPERFSRMVQPGKIVQKENTK